jgi:hypothetical protein
LLGASKLKNANLGTVASIAFYAVTGVLLLILLPLANYPPHIGLTGVMSLITAYALFMKRPWGKWLVASLFFVVTTISIYTVYFILFSNPLVSIALIVYAVLTWYFTYYVFIKKL